MTFYDIAAILITLTGLFSYLNHRLVRLPGVIGIMVITLVFSLGLLLLGQAGLIGFDDQIREMLADLDFHDTLMHGMLGALLFAGALHVEINDLLQRRWIISLLATFGVLVSTLLVGGLAWICFQLLGLDADLRYCLLFGALISPTDPIAVLGIMKQVGAPPDLKTIITGESLFNDGMGVVVFLSLLLLLQGHSPPDPAAIGHLLLLEVGGGIGFGLILGYGCYFLLKQVDRYQVEILLTLAVVAGGYRLAELLHLSAPLAIVVAGLLVGNRGRHLGMSATTRRHLDSFWELVDETLNGVLFVLIGLEVLVLPLDRKAVLAGALLIPAVLFARLISVGGAMGLLAGLKRHCERGTVPILTWAGLRGGISVALALALPPGRERTLILTVTYLVVIFSILVQGLSTGALIRRLRPPASPAIDQDHLP